MTFRTLTKLGCAMLLASSALAQTMRPERVKDPRAGTFNAPIRGPRPVGRPDGLGTPRDSVPGDTCIDPHVITALPFQAVDDSCNYGNDYDQACPLASSARDAVYLYVPPVDQYIDIVLCDSLHDTKVFVYEGLCSGTVVGCNDDACGPSGFQSQLLGIPVTAGESYYLVVDGWGSSCGEYTLVVSEAPLPPSCPPDSLAAVPVELNNGQGATSDDVGGFLGYAPLSSLPGPFCSLQFWGLNRRFAGQWFNCDKADPNEGFPPERFEITVHEDLGGLPGAAVCGPHIAQPVRVDTGRVLGTAPLYRYRILIPWCDPPGGDAWISIKGLNDGQNCWFLWAAVPRDPNYPGTRALQEDLVAGGFIERSYDLTLCVGDFYDPNLAIGACCDPRFGTCTEAAEIADCASEFARFVPNTTCAELQPPCELLSGACCYADGDCAVRTYTECLTQPGDLNCDDIIDFDDVNPFVLAMLGQDLYVAEFPNCDWYRADMNRDGTPDFDDINPFVIVLTEGLSADRAWLGPETTCDDCPCQVPCPAGAYGETEACGEATNDGCDVAPDAFAPLTCGTTVCGTIFADAAASDHDYYVFDAPYRARFTLTVSAEFPVHFGFVAQDTPGVPGCDNFLGLIDPNLATAACQQETLTHTGPAGTYYAVVQPQKVGLVHLCPTAYTIALDCVEVRACCLPNGTCLPGTTSDECNAAGGTWQDAGVVCDPENPCFQPPKGRCCYGNPVQCLDDQTAAECQALSGTWDEGLTCGIPCPDLIGETCEQAIIIDELPYASTVDLKLADDHGPAASCDPITNPTDAMQNDSWWRFEPNAPCFGILRVSILGDYRPVGVVWHDDGDCLDPNELACAAPGGPQTYELTFDAEPNNIYFFQLGDAGTTPILGDGRTLIEFTCSLTQGACCFLDGSCQDDLTAAECVAANGSYQGDGTFCDPNLCPQPTAGNDCNDPFIVLLDPSDYDPNSFDPNDFDPNHIDPNEVVFHDRNATCGRAFTYAATCLDNYDSGEDMLYEITVPIPMQLSFTVDPRGTPYSGFALGTACPPSDPNNCLAVATDRFGNGLPYGIDCIALDAGTYYLMLDTWAPPYCIGDFDLYIDECLPCFVTCPPGGSAEGEPICQADYEDTFNAGCNSDPATFLPIACGDTICGESGTFLYLDPNSLDPNDPNGPVYLEFRDTDWFEFVAPEAYEYTWTVEAEFPVHIFVIAANAGDCSDDEVIADAVGNPCEPASITTQCQPGATYWFMVTTDGFTGVPCGSPYTSQLACNTCELDPYCPATTEYCYEYIANVQFGTLDNPSQCTNYGDYTAQSTPVTPGSVVPVQVDVGNHYDEDVVNVWFDWNQDIDLTDETPVALTHEGGGVYTGQVAIPTSIPTGPTRMRVRLDFFTTDGPCGEAPYGEVEDYTVMVQ